MKKIAVIFLLVLTTCSLPQEYIKNNYEKNEYRVTMRDGITLFTSVYAPKDTSEFYPILMMRTPYSCAPYGEGFRDIEEYLLKEKFIFVFQDVRGKFLSEGKYENMRPVKSDKDPNAVDEVTDTYDTIEWLVNNIPHNNGNVGMFGISYPGFYAALGGINSHPALKCISPQAPIADWFIGDDMHHHGALSLLLNFNFFSTFGQEPDSLFTTWPPRFDYVTQDAYNFFLDIGPLKNVNEKYFHGKIPFWNDVMNHGTYDTFWQERNTLPHFNNINPAVLTVGGWYDGEDLYGALNTYAAIERNNKNVYNIIVLGPWIHGGWVRTTGESLGDVSFSEPTFEFYTQGIELPFFRHFLKGVDTLNLPEAIVFETGSNVWKEYSSWPPENIKGEYLYFNESQNLAFSPENLSAGYDEYLSDPEKPVPYTAKIQDAAKFYNKAFLTEDQRFVSNRPDVLVFETDVLQENLTIAGPIIPELFVSTTGTDADWVVKIIDLHPDSAREINGIEWGGYEELVRGDIFRGKFRDSYSSPKPFVPGKVTRVSFKMQDVNHTFKAGHKIMIQIQSSWFSLFDRNPQTFVDINKAEKNDFIKATHRVYYGGDYKSCVKINVLK